VQTDCEVGPVNVGAEAMTTVELPDGLDPPVHCTVKDVDPAAAVGPINRMSVAVSVGAELLKLTVACV